MEKIRPVEEKDIPTVIQLCKAHAQFEKADYAITDKAEKLSKILFKTNSSLKCLVVELDEEIVGYATFMKQFSTWDASFYLYLDCLYFEPSARGLGLGKLVMNYIWVFAKAENCFQVQWQTPDFNENAIGFYKKLGAISKTKERFFWSVENEESTEQ